MRKTSALTPLIAALALTAAAVLVAFSLPLPAHAETLVVGDGDGDFVTGSGHEVDLRRQVPAFTRLRLDGPVDVEAHPGGAPGVTVHADDNIAPLIETAVEGDTLVVRLRQGANFKTRHPTRVSVEFATLAGTAQRGSGDLHLAGIASPKLDSVISGSGDLEVEDAQLGSFSLRVAGSGDARIAGRADEARITIAGSGDVRAPRFPVRRVDVSINGSGDALVNATGSIAARIAGSGDVRYLGHPSEVSRQVSGSGSVEAAD